MANIELRLSSKVDAMGKSQIIVKLTLSRNQRPCFKSGVYVRPEWFQATQETKKGSVYGIVVPKRGKLNVSEVSEATDAKTMLDNYVSRLLKIANVLNGMEEVTREAIEDAISLTNDVPAEKVTYGLIIDTRKKAKKKEAIGDGADSFFGMMELYLKKNEFSKSWGKIFHVLMRTMARYQSFVRLTDKERKQFRLDIDTITKDTIEDFFDYARNGKSLSEEYPNIFRRLLIEYPAEIATKRKNTHLSERGHNTITLQMKTLRAFFKWCYQKDYTTNDPFKVIEVSSEKYGTPYYISLEERNTIADYDLSEKKDLEVQRDIFIFQCLIGCRVSDLLSLTEKNVIGGAVEYIPRKTKDKKPIVVRVPLNKRAQALVEKYRGMDSKGRLFPFIGAEKYNDAIREVLTTCGITRMVTILNPTTGKEEQRPINEIASSHMARRTFIGNLYRQVKDPNLIGALSGHTEGSKAFARYRDIDEGTKREVISLIN